MKLVEEKEDQVEIEDGGQRRVCVCAFQAVYNEIDTMAGGPGGIGGAPFFPPAPLLPVIPSLISRTSSPFPRCPSHPLSSTPPSLTPAEPWQYKGFCGPFPQSSGNDPW